MWPNILAVIILYVAFMLFLGRLLSSKWHPEDPYDESDFYD